MAFQDSFLKVFAIIFIISASISFAHQPNIVSGQVMQVSDPEVSKAFYGELRGAPAYFEINSDKPFKLYVGVLVPDVSGINKDVSAEVSKDGKRITLLNASDSNWSQFYEEFGGDYYFQGPELRSDANPGNYTIKVFSDDNNGKYVLAVGEKESFGFNDMVNAIFAMPNLKTWFFGKSILDVFSGKICSSMSIAILIVLAILALAFWKLRKGPGKNIART